MFKQALLASLLLAGAPALAQTAQPATPADPAVPPPAAGNQGTSPTATTPDSATTTVTTDQPMTGTASTPVTSGTDAAASSAQASTTDSTMATIEADWAKYDTNNNGSLSRTELNRWLTAQQKAAGNKAPSRSYLAAAFQKADADKSRTVTKEELAAYLGQ
jgi:hypothetical protein